jgi:hypothetical protein
LRKRNGLGFRVGFGGFPTAGTSTYTIPVQINYLFGKKNKFIEIGAGATIVDYELYETYCYISTNNQTVTDKAKSRHSFVAATIKLAYRYQPVKSVLNFRAGISPTIITPKQYMYYNEKRFQLLPEISAGYTFK